MKYAPLEVDMDLRRRLSSPEVRLRHDAKDQIYFLQKTAPKDGRAAAERRLSVRARQANEAGVRSKAAAAKAAAAEEEKKKREAEVAKKRAATAASVAAATKAAQATATAEEGRLQCRN